MKRHILSLLLVVVALGACGMFSFLPALENGFTNWDDPEYLLGNPLVQKPFVPAVQEAFGQTLTGKYNPIPLMSYWLDFRLVGTSARGYHRVNLILHLINAVLVFFLLRQWSRRQLAALAGALVFVAHPLNSEVVCWISSRKDLWAAFFYFSGLLSYSRYLRDRSNLWLGMTYGAFTGLVFSKITAVTFPLTLFILDFWTQGRLQRKDVINKTLFILVIFILGTATWQAAHRADAFPASASTTAVQQGFLSLKALGFYLSRWVWPFPLTAFTPWDAPWPVAALLTAVFTLGAGSLFLILQGKGREVALGWGFFVVTLLPFLHFLVPNDSLVYERLMYIPAVGLCFLVGNLFDWLFFRRPSWRAWPRWAIVAAGVLVILSGALISRSQCRVWRNSETLWQNVIRHFPRTAIAHHNLGEYYFSIGEWLPAMQSFKRAVDIAPGYASAYYNMGNTAERLEDYAAAESYYTQALGVDPDFLPALSNRGNMRFLLGDVDGALSDYDEAVRRQPNAVNPRLNRGMVLFAQKRFEDARNDFEAVLQRDPHNPLAQDKMKALEKLDGTKP